MIIKNKLKNEMGFVHLISIFLGIIIFSVISGAAYFVITQNSSKKEKPGQQTTKYDDQRVDNSVLNELKGAEFDE
jgi:hypothetical protein